MAQPTGELPRARLAGTVLTCFGVVGIVTGVVPFVVNLARILGHDWGMSASDWMAHGVEAMGLSLEWAALSSASGAFLGGLLFAAGYGWRRGRRWAPLVTFIYGLDGVVVCGTDLAIFALAATPGRVRTMMLLCDGIALAVAAGALIGLLLWRRRGPR